jgi:serine phosphatase RsbU (regulator of sigma subunit)
LSRISYFTIIELRTDRYGSSEDSFNSMILWSAVFLLGPSSLWIGVIYNLIDFIRNWRSASNPPQRWSVLRTSTVAIAVNTFAYLCAISIYQYVGGQFPIAGLSLLSISQGFIALSSEFLIVLLLVSGYLIYHIGIQRLLAEDEEIQPMVRFFLIAVAMPYLAHPFSILLTGLLVTHGVGVYIFFLVGLVLVALITRRLSFTAEHSRQQSRQLEKLEKLGRELLETIPDISSLPEILKENVPGMFASGRVAIWISPNNMLLQFPSDWQGIPIQAWNWILDQNHPSAFTINESLPWEENNSNHMATVISPIIRSDSGRTIGGIALELRALAQTWDRKSMLNLFPAIQALSDQIASTLQQTQVYEQSLEFQQISQELQIAGQIQSSFLPNVFPSIQGWQLAVTLLPAGETSGDFFDVFELSDGRLGILVADVADKGLGSALYMALCRTLIRTYAEEYDAEPEVVFYAANNRILKDARANLFVTAFYGILDPKEGLLTYCNAGHNPPFLISHSDNSNITALQRTGIAIGIENNSTWTTESIAINPGDILLLYTDGIPDAQDDQGHFFDDEAIIEITLANSDKFAHEIQSAIIEAVQDFAGNTPQFDDITLMVLMRNQQN